MTKLSTSKGIAENRGNRIFIKDTYKGIAEMHMQNNYEEGTFKPVQDIEREANQTVMLDGFNTYNECGLLSSEVLTQRNSLYNTLKLVRDGMTALAYSEEIFDAVTKALEENRNP